MHDKIGKIALVTNSPMGTFADHVLDPLMSAMIRKFDYDQRHEAMGWLQGWVPGLPESIASVPFCGFCHHLWHQFTI